MSASPEPEPRPRAAAWARICAHIDGMALGTTVEALHAHGVLARLAAPRRAVPVAALAEETGAVPGYLELALRLLALQGWVEPRRHPGVGGAVRFADQGRRWHVHGGLYVGAVSRLALAQRLAAALVQGTELGAADRALLEREVRGARPGGTDVMLRRVLLHRQGPLVAAAAWAMLRAGLLPEDPDEPVVAGGPTQALASALLAAQGWLVPGARGWRRSPAGRAALSAGAQYGLALAYLPLLERAGALIFGAGLSTAQVEEAYLDRQTDIDFSGEVVARHCRAALREAIAPLYRGRSPAAVPRVIVDTGCGDGRMLEAIDEIVRDHAPAGFRPLLVGVDPSPVARRQTRARLAGRAVPHLVVAGDVGRPEALAHTLAGHGIRLDEALHVCKSVIHDRAYRAHAPFEHVVAQATEGVFLTESGERIQGPSLLADLAAHFRAWVPWIRRHGLIAIEAHIVPARVAAAQAGRHVLTLLEASHGYSHQYLVEAACHRAAAASAGLCSLHRRDLLHVAGEPTLTLDHWWPLPDTALSGLLK